MQYTTPRGELVSDAGESCSCGTVSRTKQSKDQRRFRSWKARPDAISVYEGTKGSDVRRERTKRTGLDSRSDPTLVSSLQLCARLRGPLLL